MHPTHRSVFVVLALAGGLACAAAQAADRPPGDAKFKDLPEPPPLSQEQRPADAASDNPEPEVTITTRGADRYEEYRVRGQLYMIKVTPAHGKPYYLIDNEGTGQMSRSDLAPSIKVPLWVIKRF